MSITATVHGGVSEGRATSVLKPSYMTYGGNGVFAAVALAMASASAILARGVPATVTSRKCISGLLKATRYFASSGVPRGHLGVGADDYPRDAHCSGLAEYEKDGLVFDLRCS
ncbi:hypothetical protein E2562_034095 [Oryza meyeriana var. granulata]|uniref:Uncharacterized protein n=1 Tax=Oryza meyeriana var. granulata TaxID=110450 RepID=A0A6G1E8G2_9ORYZ|nr:hypothetical protein E2562_034095 [Oryza meyeriana var. granulata]